MMSQQHTDILLQLGQRIREIRKAKRLSQKTLGKSCGVHYTDISRIERGLKNVELLTILKIAEVLATEVHDLFVRTKK